MNRRLHNSYFALLASASTLALCLALALPAQQQTQQQAKARPIALNVGPVEFTFTPSDPNANHGAQIEALTRSIERRADKVESLADAAALTAEIATAAALAEAVKSSRSFQSATIDTEQKQARTAARHRRQTLVMPYFSFAPRG